MYIVTEETWRDLTSQDAMMVGVKILSCLVPEISLTLISALRQTGHDDPPKSPRPVATPRRDRVAN